MYSARAPGLGQKHFAGAAIWITAWLKHFEGHHHIVDRRGLRVRGTRSVLVAGLRCRATLFEYRQNPAGHEHTLSGAGRKALQRA